MTWRARAACKGRTDLFYPASDERQPYQVEYRERQAARLCAACPVAEACLADELEQTPKAQDIDGYRAGMTADARRRLWRRYHQLTKGERRRAA